jgi:hypothetical protein
VPESAEASPSPRWRHALSWWWVSELVRRHPYLVVWEHVSASGQQDTLVVAKPLGDRFERRMEINRNGTIHVPGREIPMVGGPWGHLLDAEDPHALITQMESAAGLGHPRSTPPTQPNSLSIRLISAVLMAKVHDTDTWTCRMDATDATWTILRGAEAVARVDLAGEVLLEGEETPRSVIQEYDAHDRRLIPTMAALFGPVL